MAHALEIPTSAVTVHVTLVGGAFGRRLNVDYGVEAAFAFAGGWSAGESFLDARGRYSLRLLPAFGSCTDCGRDWMSRASWWRGCIILRRRRRMDITKGRRRRMFRAANWRGRE